jgi:hypothetical protein
MEQHVHPGVQMVGFYFLDTPDPGSRALFHDPRPGKMSTDMPERNMSQASPASGTINFECQPGDMIITNSWLPHSFSRHGSVKPFRFVHFNIYTQLNTPSVCEQPPTAEII